MADYFCRFAQIDVDGERKGGRIVEGETADAVKETASLLRSEAKVL